MVQTMNTVKYMYMYIHTHSVYGYTYLYTDYMKARYNHVSLPHKPRWGRGGARMEVGAMIRGKHIELEIWTDSKSLRVRVRRSTGRWRRERTVHCILIPDFSPPNW